MSAVLFAFLLVAAEPGVEFSKNAPPNAASLPAPATVPAPKPKLSAVPDDPVEKEYLKLLLLDDEAQKEVDKWIREANSFGQQGAGVPQATLLAKAEQRFKPVRDAYEDFLRRHPRHTEARLAYGSFLNDIHEEDEAVEQWEKARSLDPSNPASWNNLANHFGHRGPVEKSFEYYDKAIALDPEEPVYLQNQATTTYLFRTHAMEYYKITEKEVFDRALELYRKAIKLDPTNFPLATDYAQTFYGIKPMRTQDALKAWNDALKVANDDIEREGVYVHLARISLNSALFDDARRHLAGITNQMYDGIKERLERNLKQKEAKWKETNSVSQPSVAPAK